MNKNKTWIIGIASAIGCEIIYGMSFIFTKQATQIASPFALLGWRFAVAFLGMSLLVILGIIKINFKGKDVRHLIKLAIYFPITYFIGEAYGISETTAAESGVALAGIPIAALVASTIMLGKKPTKFELKGIITTFLGVIITVLAVGSKSSFSIKGYLFLSMAIIAYSIYCVFVERANKFSGSEITYIMLLVAFIIFGFIAFGESVFKENTEEFLKLPINNGNFFLAILYQGIGCSIFAFILSNIAIANVGTNRMASFIGIATVVSIMSAYLILKEPFTWLQVLGAVVIMLGVYIANMKKE